LERPTGATFVVGKPNTIMLNLAVQFPNYDRITETKDLRESTRFDPKKLEKVSNQ